MEHFTLFELGQQDFARGEARPYWIDERGADRLAGYDSAYADSLAKAEDQRAIGTPFVG